MVDHHAAHVNVRKSVEMPVYDATINILGSLNLCELSRKYNVKKFVYISTGGAVYGEPKELPVPETCTVDPLANMALASILSNIIWLFLSVIWHEFHRFKISECLWAKRSHRMEKLG